MNTLLNSSSVNKIYLFHDGVLDPTINLPTNLNIQNKAIYTKNTGGTTWQIAREVLNGSKLFVRLKCQKDSGSSGKEASSSITFGNNIGIIRFPGNDEINKPLIIGVEAIANAINFTIYLYTYANSMGITDIWIEN